MVAVVSTELEYHLYDIASCDLVVALLRIPEKCTYLRDPDFTIIVGVLRRPSYWCGAGQNA